MKASELLKILPSQETVVYFQRSYDYLDLKYIAEDFQLEVYFNNLEEIDEQKTVYIKSDFAELRKKIQVGDEITVKIEKDLIVSNGKLDICFKAMDKLPEINWKESEPLASLYIGEKDWVHLKAAAKIAKLNEGENVELPMLQNVHIEALATLISVTAISKNYVTQRQFYSSRKVENYLDINIPANAIIEADKLSSSQKQELT